MMANAAMVLLILAAVLAVTGAQGNYAVLRLERRFTNASMEDLVKMDLARQGRDQGIARLPVIGEGYSYQEIIGGPYLTRVQLGTPPKEFRVLIDTGSSMPWIDCNTTGAPGLTVG
ncbi:hypothetical protein QYE76_053416 [Lolium multiflorum]|uniref:Peptidase A1 domain-containing protein n=1 Tax=Lolium multiflorum TaxID=4521 RepID=A0AAD8WJT6_LOLMU|nr:hypothetical protein QYE76_053416 [Lolium multiflorum]